MRGQLIILSVKNLQRGRDNILLLYSDGEETSNFQDVADLFCSYFSTIVKNLDRHIDIDIMNYLPDSAPHSLEEVEHKIYFLQNKSCHINNIMIFVMKNSLFSFYNNDMHRMPNKLKFFPFYR